LTQPREERIQNHKRLPFARGGERSRERPPGGGRAGHFAAGHDPALRRLRVLQKPPVDEQVFVREGGERFAQFGGRPQQQAFGLLAIGVEGRLRVDEAREPRLDGIDIVLRCNLRTGVERAIRVERIKSVNSKTWPQRGLLV
jgi:hypothetical protein